MPDGGYAVFNRYFWDSAVLSPIDHALLTQLLNSCASVPQDVLVCGAADATGYPNDQAFGRYCGEALQQLSFIGLISAVDES